MSSGGAAIVGVDIGGTFTDFVLFKPKDGSFHLHKTLTTPSEPSRAVIEGLRELLEAADVSSSQLSLTVHGTTLVTNSLIERKGAKTALVTSKGHRDVLEIGTELRYDAYNLFLKKPEPLVSRPLRFGVDERLDHKGLELRPLDEVAIEEVAASMERAGVESIAVCFLHSFRDARHERAAAEKLRKHLPWVSISLSSEVAPEIREYQRTSTTVANAYVKPLAQRYLDKLRTDLKELGYRYPLYMMLSSGGITTAEVASQYPIQLLESGPAGGALCTSFLGRLLGRQELVSFDMGGTTAKMSYITSGRPALARSFEVGRVERFHLGSGLPVQVPVIEMIEIGAGGGSIAFKDGLGLLKVGPESAGADPGPACYGFGGDAPTVTDANLLLGYLSSENFLGGRMRLDAERAKSAIEEKVARPLGLDVVTAAAGIFDVVNENMVGATKVHVAEKGKDPRRSSLVAFGGAGPIHAHAVALALKMREVICPLRAGVASALGFLTAPIAFDFAQSVALPIDELTSDVLADVFFGMESRGTETLKDAGIGDSDVTFERSADLRFVGQGHEVEVPLPSGKVDDAYLKALPGHFHRAYHELYGQTHTDVALEIITCRVTASGPRPSITLPTVEEQTESVLRARKGSRPVYFKCADSAGFVETPVYDRYRLKAGARFPGPAVVEEAESTVIVPPQMTASIDVFGNMLLQVE